MSFTSEQNDAITSPASIAVIASAGTGKTTVLTQRILQLHESGRASLSRILAFTFTEKAAAEMKERLIRSGLDLAALANLHMGTIHAFCLGLASRHAEFLGCPPKISILNENVAYLQHLRKIENRLHDLFANGTPPWRQLSVRYGIKETTRMVKALMKHNLLALDDQEICCLNPANDIPFHGKIIDAPGEVLTPFLQEIRCWQKEEHDQRCLRGELVFDDLEILTLRLFENAPDILERLRRRFQEILVDEVQDISPLQEKIIRRLFHPEHNHLFIVGDPKQSIYGFRQGNPACFKRLTQVIIAHGGKEIELSHTFRTPPLLQKAFNHYFGKLFADADVHYAEMTTHNNDAVSALHLISPASETRTAEALSESILADLLPRVQMLMNRGVAASEIAIISATHQRLGFLAEKLSQSGIAVSRNLEIPLMEDARINLVVHLLLVIAGKSDTIYQMAIVHNPLFDFSQSFIDNLLRSQTQDFFSEHTLELFSTTREKDAWQKIVKTLQAAKELAPMLSPFALTELIAGDLDLHARFSDGRLWQGFLNLLEDYSQSSGLTTSLSADFFLELIRQDFYLAREQDARQGISLLSVHAAKGLEFAHVFVVPGGRGRSDSDLFFYDDGKGFVFKAPVKEDDSPGLKPETLKSPFWEETRARAAMRDALEQRRLIYVALTRTKQALYVYTPAPSKKLQGEFSKDKPDLWCFTRFDEWLCYAKTVLQPHDALDWSQHADVPVADALAAQIATDKPAAPDSTAFAPPIVSVSEFETFSLCPKRYHLQYVLGLPMSDYINVADVDELKSPVKTRLNARERGLFFHEVLQFYDFQKHDNLDTVYRQALFNQRVEDPTGSLLAECQLFLLKLTKDSLLISVLASPEFMTEKKFSIPVGGFILQGQIDRLCRFTNAATKINEWLVLDYKTAVILSDEDKAAHVKQYAFQMSCYALAASRIFEQDEVRTLILFTSGPQGQLIRYQAHDLKDFATLIERQFAEMTTCHKTGEYPHTENASLCRSCPYFKNKMCGGV